MIEKLTVRAVGKHFTTVADMVNEFHEIGKAIEMLKAEQDRLKALILDDMDGVESKNYKIGKTTFTVTYKGITSTRVDTKALKAKYPQIAAECSITSTSPRFTIK